MIKMMMLMTIIVMVLLMVMVELSAQTSVANVCYKPHATSYDDGT